MLKQSQKTAENLNTQLNVEESHSLNSTELVKMNDIENTPFKLVTVERGSFIAYGNNRLSSLMPTKEEALKIVEEKNWDFLGSFIISVITSFNNYQNQTK